MRHIAVRSLDESSTRQISAGYLLPLACGRFVKPQHARPATIRFIEPASIEIGFGHGAAYRLGTHPRCAARPLVCCPDMPLLRPHGGAARLVARPPLSPLAFSASLSSLACPFGGGSPVSASHACRTTLHQCASPCRLRLRRPTAAIEMRFLCVDTESITASTCRTRADMLSARARWLGTTRRGFGQRCPPAWPWTSIIEAGIGALLILSPLISQHLRCLARLFQSSSTAANRLSLPNRRDNGF